AGTIKCTIKPFDEARRISRGGLVPSLFFGQVSGDLDFENKSCNAQRASSRLPLLAPTSLLPPPPQPTTAQPTCVRPSGEILSNESPSSLISSHPPHDTRLTTMASIDRYRPPREG